MVLTSMTIFIKLIIDPFMERASITQNKNETIEILHLNRKSLWNIFFGLKCDWQPWLNGCEWKLALKSTRYQNRSKIEGFLPDSLAGISFIFLPLIKKHWFFPLTEEFLEYTTAQDHANVDAHLNFPWKWNFPPENWHVQWHSYQNLNSSRL